MAVIVAVNDDGYCEVIGAAETLTYTRFPRERWGRIRTNDAIKRPDHKMRRRAHVVDTFPDGNSALMLVTARLKCVAESR